MKPLDRYWAAPLTFKSLSKTLLHLSGGLDVPSKEGIPGKDDCPFNKHNQSSTVQDELRFTSTNKSSDFAIYINQILNPIAKKCLH